MAAKGDREDGAVGRLRRQYEAYPYPARDPRDEAKRLIIGSPSHLAELDHFVFAGRRPPARPFRALVAGGGTGDATVMLAQQVADAGGPAEIVHIDLSEASLAIAEARVKARRLDNVTFRRLSLLDLPGSGLGRFDYIDCCGVLHHLDDSGAGLAALVAVLDERGGLGLMLYGALGRTGVYPAQAMLRALADDAEAEPAARVGAARRLLAQLPPTNWLRRNPFVADHLKGDDAGLYDLLLHSRDRAYTVPEVAALAAAAGLRITAFVEPALYDPAAYLTDPRILDRLARLPWLERCAFAENLAGTLRKHIFYAVKADHPGPCVADPSDETLVPVWREAADAAFGRSIRPGGALTANRDGVAFRFPLPPLAGAILSRIDGRRPIAAIREDLTAANPGLSHDAFSGQFGQTFSALNGIGKLFLRHPPG